MNQTGTDLVLLTTQGGDYPDWSPDGTQIAFASRRDGDLDIYTMSADGSNQVKLIGLPDSWEYSPVWSPDGTQIAFASQSPLGIAHGDIYVVNADGTNLRILTEGISDSLNYSPSWSPDGLEILFLSNTNYEPQGGAFRSDYDFFTVGVDGTNVTMLSRGGPLGSAELSPNGDTIIFDEFEVGLNLNSEIAAIPHGQNAVYLLSAYEGADVDPSWSPDGSLIVFIRFENGHYVLYTMLAADGSNQTRVTTLEVGDERHADWQPVFSRAASE